MGKRLMSWRFAFASAIGTSHVASGTPCQDYGECVLMPDANGQQVLVAVAADGAGSASMSQDGAMAAGATVMELVKARLAEAKTVDETWARDWLGLFQRKIGAQAFKAGLTGRDYACTVLVAVVSSSEAAFWQVGDGAIVYTSSNTTDYRLTFAPEKGEYANVTYFATDEFAKKHLHFKIVSDVQSLALFTDGIERLALDLKSSSAFAPFFRPMFTPLEALPAEQEGEARNLSEALRAFLNSPTVNERTDDDKTLILATRLQTLEQKPATADVTL